MGHPVYEAFPPHYKPRFDRPAPDVLIRNILYFEDTIRARFHKEHTSLPSVNLSDQRMQTQTQKLTLRLLMSYICGAPSKARNANVVYIWTYVWQR